MSRKPTDEQLYKKAQALGSIRAAALHYGLSFSGCRDRITLYCHKNKLQSPAKRAPEGPDGKAIYEKVMELGSLNAASQFFKFDRDRLSRRLSSYCAMNGLDRPEGPSRHKKDIVVEYPSQQTLRTEGTQRFIVTSMHNNTPLNAAAFKALKACAEHIGAQFCIIPLLYKNPNLFSSAQALAVEWPAEALPYTIHDNIIINDEWMIAGKLHIQATAARPLSALQGFSKERSAVIGHARLAWETRPTPPGRPAIRQITTGSISQPLYSDTKLGQLSDFHHTLGALLIETDGTRTFVRHLRPSTSTGEFFDFEHHYGPAGYIGTDEKAIAAAVFGDLHEWFSDEKALVYSFLHRYKPRHAFVHDAIDSFSISHHHEKNPLMRMAKKTLKMDHLEEEIGDLCEFHNSLPAETEIVYVSSNHTEDHIMRWLSGRDWRQIDSNTHIHRFILNAYMDLLEKPEFAAEYAEEGRLPSVMELLMGRAGADLDNARFPSVNDSVMVFDIECGQHGHRGPNGSKGTPGAFRNSQYKMIIGHIHSPGMYDGIYVVGTSGGLKMNYNDGLSGWDTVHSTIDRLKKRRLFNTVNGQYRLEEKPDAMAKPAGKGKRTRR